jgi:hypothetical protein
MMKLGRPPTAPLLPIAMIGISARPVGSSPSMLHETVAVREAGINNPNRRIAAKHYRIAKRSFDHLVGDRE